MSAAQNRQRRHDELFRRYQASGSALPFGIWLKHYEVEQARAAQEDDAIRLPPSFWVAVGMCGLAVIVTVAIVGRAAGVW
jgi:hypothetical protein